MSRIGKKPIEIPADVEVKVEGQEILAKGPKGSAARRLHPDFQGGVQGSLLSISPRLESGRESMRAQWGTERQHTANMIKGLKEGYEKRLEIEGVGYRASVEGTNLILHVGFSVPLKLEIPEGIQVAVDKNIVAVSGIDKEKVGQFAASVRAVRKVEPYKGKGIKYEGEVFRRKLGKKAAVAAGGTPTAGKSSGG